MIRASVQSILFLGVLLCVGCVDPNYKEDEETAAATEAASEPSEEEGLTGDSFRTECGVVVGGVLKNPVYASQGERVRVTQVVDSTFLIVQRQAGAQLVQLQGIRGVPTYEASAVNTLSSLIQEDAFLFEPGTGCFSETASGGRGIVGHLVSASGTSFSEKLIEEGLVDSDSTPFCGSELVSSCYSALRGEPPPTSAGEVTDFLWKPQADSQYNPGKLVVHASPCNMRVIVNGEELPDYGSGNGRCITARAQKSGCAYGRNVRVQLIDKNSGLPYSHAGLPYVVVPDGCQRFEFKG